MARTFLVLVAASVFVATADRSQGGIVATTGAMTEISAPASFIEGATESSTEIFILNEGLTLLTEEVSVNAFGPGTHGGTAPPLLSIPAGSLVHSYFVHFDPVGGSFATATGAVFFEPGEIIIGVQTHTPLLYDADAPLGHPLATYPGTLIEFRAFETLPGVDGVTLPIDMASASFTLFAELGVDHARIITTAVPEAGAWLLVGAVAAASGLASLRRLLGGNSTKVSASEAATL
jgi:hypothetical protein